MLDLAPTHQFSEVYGTPGLKVTSMQQSDLRRIVQITIDPTMIELDEDAPFDDAKVTVVASARTSSKSDQIKRFVHVKVIP